MTMPPEPRYLSVSLPEATWMDILTLIPVHGGGVERGTLMAGINDARRKPPTPPAQAETIVWWVTHEPGRPVGYRAVDVSVDDPTGWLELLDADGRTMVLIKEWTQVVAEPAVLAPDPYQMLERSG
jgi:hypothetical protein